MSSQDQLWLYWSVPIQCTASKVDCHKSECSDKMMSLVRRARQQQEWEERQAERKARQAEMAGEPFDKEVSQLSLAPFNSRRSACPVKCSTSVTSAGMLCHICQVLSCLTSNTCKGCCLLFSKLVVLQPTSCIDLPWPAGLTNFPASKAHT